MHEGVLQRAVRSAPPPQPCCVPAPALLRMPDDGAGRARNAAAMYGHIARMAQAIQEGLAEVPGVQVELYQARHGGLGASGRPQRRGRRIRSRVSGPPPGQRERR